jgi:hypothetical protein
MLFSQEVVPWGEEFQVNSYTDDDQYFADVCALTDGGFVTCWLSKNQGNFPRSLIARRYSEDGNPVGGEFRVSSEASRILISMHNVMTKRHSRLVRPFESIVTYQMIKPVLL